MANVCDSRCFSVVKRGSEGDVLRKFIHETLSVRILLSLTFIFTFDFFVLALMTSFLESSRIKSKLSLCTLRNFTSTSPPIKDPNLIDIHWRLTATTNPMKCFVSGVKYEQMDMHNSKNI